MKDFVQPGNVHLKGPSSVAQGCSILEPSGPITVVVEFEAVEINGAKCFLDMCPVKAASEAKLALSQPCHPHLTTPLMRWTLFKCFLRSVAEAKLAPHTVPQGIIHWQAREVGGADTADNRALVSLSAPSDIGVGVGGVGRCVDSIGVGG